MVQIAVKLTQKIQTEAEEEKKELYSVGLLVFLYKYILSLWLLDKNSTCWGAENDFTRESKQQCELCTS